jgi:hypothetical protein
MKLFGQAIYFDVLKNTDPVRRSFRIFKLEHAFNIKTLQKLLPYSGTALPKHAAK